MADPLTDANAFVVLSDLQCAAFQREQALQRARLGIAEPAIEARRPMTASQNASTSYSRGTLAAHLESILEQLDHVQQLPAAGINVIQAATLSEDIRKAQQAITSVLFLVEKAPA